MPQMNPPPVSPRLCHRTSGASIALGGGRGPGDESARPLCSRHFQRTDTTAPVSGRSEVDTQAPGRGWAVGPPRAVGCRNRGPPLDQGGGWRKKPSRRTVSPPPPPALPHHPFPPGYVPPPISMGKGGSRHGALSTMRRRGDYRQGATAAGDPGVRSLYHGEGREGPKENPPPPRCSQVPHPVLASCLRRACDMRAAEGRRHGRPYPPHTPPPPQGWGMQVGAGEKRPPPEDKAAGWGGNGERMRDGPHDRARREHAPCMPQRGTTGGANAR